MRKTRTVLLNAAHALTAGFRLGFTQVLRTYFEGKPVYTKTGSGQPAD